MSYTTSSVYSNTPYNIPKDTQEASPSFIASSARGQLLKDGVHLTSQEWTQINSGGLRHSQSQSDNPGKLFNTFHIPLLASSTKPSHRLMLRESCCTLSEECDEICDVTHGQKERLKTGPKEMLIEPSHDRTNSASLFSDLSTGADLTDSIATPTRSPVVNSRLAATPSSPLTPSPYGTPILEGRELDTSMKLLASQTPPQHVYTLSSREAPIISLNRAPNKSSNSIELNKTACTLAPTQLPR